MEWLTQEFKEDKESMKLEKGKGLEGLYHDQKKIKVLMSNLTMFLIFGNSPMSFLFFSFADLDSNIQKLEEVSHLF